MTLSPVSATTYLSRQLPAKYFRHSMVAACIVYGGLFGIVAMCALAAFLLLKSSRLHKKRTQDAALALSLIHIYARRSGNGPYAGWQGTPQGREPG